jgi:2-polyprenyl-3-methyl-5-hydroxy-6-metoxy-1,4-benzoquinol methylase
MKTLFLPDDYVSRATPAPFPDADDGLEWQCGAYEILRRMVFPDSGVARSSVVDVGCGQARKLERFRSVEQVTVFDTQDTVTKLREQSPWLKSYPVNLDGPFALAVPLGSAVICADVVEHLASPHFLINELARLRNSFGCSVILTTPDRILTHGPDHKGPPPNPAHVREWSMSEFVRFCAELGLTGGEWSHTQTHDKSDNKHTITGVFT